MDCKAVPQLHHLPPGRKQRERWPRPNYTGAIHRHGLLLLYFHPAGDCLRKACATTPSLHQHGHVAP